MSTTYDIEHVIPVGLSPSTLISGLLIALKKSGFLISYPIDVIEHYERFKEKTYDVLGEEEFVAIAEKLSNYFTFSIVDNEWISLEFNDNFTLGHFQGPIVQFNLNRTTDNPGRHIYSYHPHDLRYGKVHLIHFIIESWPFDAGEIVPGPMTIEKTYSARLYKLACDIHVELSCLKTWAGYQPEFIINEDRKYDSLRELDCIWSHWTWFVIVNPAEYGGRETLVEYINDLIKHHNKQSRFYDDNPLIIDLSDGSVFIRLHKIGEE